MVLGRGCVLALSERFAGEIASGEVKRAAATHYSVQLHIRPHFQTRAERRRPLPRRGGPEGAIRF